MKYDCVWVQWVLCYLTDHDILKFFNDCREHLNEGGMLFVKENVAEEGFYVDKSDNSVMRADRMFIHLFQEAGFEVMRHQY